MEGIKGFFLSIDAMLGITIVIAAIAVLAFYQNSTDAESIKFEQLSTKKNDSALMGFYSRQAPAQLDPGKPYYNCTKQFVPMVTTGATTTQIENTPLNSTPDYGKYSYCEEAT